MWLCIYKANNFFLKSLQIRVIFYNLITIPAVLWYCCRNICEMGDNSYMVANNINNGKKDNSDFLCQMGDNSFYFFFNNFITKRHSAHKINMKEIVNVDILFCIIRKITLEYFHKPGWQCWNITISLTYLLGWRRMGNVCRLWFCISLNRIILWEYICIGVRLPVFLSKLSCWLICICDNNLGVSPPSC